MPRLRPYQADAKHAVYNAWREGHRNVLLVAPTGSGKTVVLSDVIAEHQGASIAVAHRQELVSQISLALARNGVRHRIIGADHVPRTCVQLHMAELKRSYYDPSAMCAVAGVDTLVRMEAANNPWFPQITLGIQDEAHHMLQGNKWGAAAELFPNARWLGVTATPGRADGNGLGRNADGLFDTMVEAPSMRVLIRMGYLTDYRVFAPPSDIDLSGVSVTAGGDFSPEPLRKAVHGSHIVGDVVQHYLRLAPGKLGVTFAVDVQSATEIATAYKTAGVPAEVVSAKTPDTARASILRRFAQRQIMQLVNVDLFGEGFDLPAIEVVSFARPTMSFGLYCQQFGRALRVMVADAFARDWDAYSDTDRCSIIDVSSKPRAIVIDHVGNVHRHGLPDSYREWSLDRRERRSRSNLGIVPIRTCTDCGSAYEATRLLCPYCGFRPVPAGRSTPEMVAGELAELSPDALAKIRGEIDQVNGAPRIPYDATPEIVGAINRRHGERLEALGHLKQTMDRWGGVRTYGYGESLGEAQRRFWYRFGIDVASAQALTRADADALRERIERDMK